MSPPVVTMRLRPAQPPMGVRVEAMVADAARVRLELVEGIAVIGAEATGEIAEIAEIEGEMSGRPALPQTQIGDKTQASMPWGCAPSAGVISRDLADLADLVGAPGETEAIGAGWEEVASFSLVSVRAIGLDNLTLTNPNPLP